MSAGPLDPGQSCLGFQGSVWPFWRHLFIKIKMRKQKIYHHKFPFAMPFVYSKCFLIPPNSYFSISYLFSIILTAQYLVLIASNRESWNPSWNCIIIKFEVEIGSIETILDPFVVLVQQMGGQMREVDCTSTILESWHQEMRINVTYFEFLLFCKTLLKSLW